MKNGWQKAVRFGFRLLYNEAAWSYDTVSWLVSLGEWRAWQMASLPFLPQPTTKTVQVLELAHGPGHLLLTLDRLGFAPVGYDLSSHMGKQAQNRLESAGISLPLIRGMAQQLPFADHCFDAILTTFPTNFISQPASLNAIYRVLRPQGRLVIIPQAQLKGESWLVRFIEWLYQITGQKPTDENHLSPLLNCLHRAGFQSEMQIVNFSRSRVWVVIAKKGEPH